jgi:HlyD family secretion protein
MIAPQARAIIRTALGCAVLAASLFAVAAATQAQDRSAKADSDEGRWLAVAPGRVQPVSGEIRIAAPVMGVVGEVPVKANDKVFAGEPLVRLNDNEIQARYASAEAQVATRRRARNAESPSAKAAGGGGGGGGGWDGEGARKEGAARPRAEDAVSDAEDAITDAQAALDKAAFERRAGSRSDADVEASRAALARAQDRLKAQKAELRKIEADSPLPTQVEGALNIARSDLAVAAAAVEKLTLRAPIGGAVLQMNAKVGELASPAAVQPLVVLGDVSALRVRAELDERDLGEIKVGQPVVVRPAAFRGREFAGKVSFIAPLVEAARNVARDQRNATDVDVVEVLVDVAEAGPLAVGMKVDVYFRPDAAPKP